MSFTQVMNQTYTIKCFEKPADSHMHTSVQAHRITESHMQEGISADHLVQTPEFWISPRTDFAVIRNLPQLWWSLKDDREGPHNDTKQLHEHPWVLPVWSHGLVYVQLAKRLPVYIPLCVSLPQTLQRKETNVSSLFLLTKHWEDRALNGFIKQLYQDME